ncbi:MAG: retinol dehydrogenase-12 [Myxococcota bacterium]|jgi:retinol dehydrogenase-12
MKKRPLVEPSVDLSGKTAIVTGANTGIGKVTALELARAGARIVLACRSERRAHEAMDEIREAVPSAKLEFARLDLASVNKARVAASEIAERFGEIHILINNAGLAGMQGETIDGFELTFGVNHIGHAVFVAGLDEVLADGARIVCVASKAHYKAKTIDFEKVRLPTKTRTGLEEYEVSKLANILYARRLQKELAARNIDVYSLHPGVVASDIWREVPAFARVVIKAFMLSNEEGARTTLHCATHPDAQGKGGLYWDKCKPKTPSDCALDDALMNKLWDRTWEWTN